MNINKQNFIFTFVNPLFIFLHTPLLCLLVAFHAPVTLLLFPANTPVHSCYTSSTTILVMTLCLCYTV